MLIGRYNKYSRECSQTAFFIGGQRKGTCSVEEYLFPPVLCHYKSDEAKFSSSGREDLDVRMLGKGRPFIIEIMEPKRVVVDQATISSMQAAINASTHRVRVTDLHLCSKAECKELRRSVTLKKKHYRCVVWAQDVLTPEKLKLLSDKIDLKVAQSTPVRVMHRRSLMVRDKVIHSMKCEYINPHFFQLDLITSSGTYIKEFVHGDRGRTIPNVCQILGCDADILQLDVVDLL
jgi:tRNA pseudouridine synthase 10